MHIAPDHELGVVVLSLFEPNKEPVELVLGTSAVVQVVMRAEHSARAVQVAISVGGPAYRMLSNNLSYGSVPWIVVTTPVKRQSRSNTPTAITPVWAAIVSTSPVGATPE